MILVFSIVSFLVSSSAVIRSLKKTAVFCVVVVFFGGGGYRVENQSEPQKKNVVRTSIS